MKESCKIYSEKIIFYDDLSKDDKEAVQSHLRECADCRAYSENVATIMRSLKSANHMNAEQLTRFIISENFPGESDFDGERLSNRRAFEIRDHLKACGSCRERYEEMRSEFKALESFIDESVTAELDLSESFVKRLFNTGQTKIARLSQNWKTLLTSPQQKFVYGFAAGFAILLLVFLFLPTLNNSENRYHKLGRLQHTEITFLTRGAGADKLKLGVSEFNKGNYSIAVEELESFISEHSDDPNREMAEYVCGLSYLFQANENLEKQIEPLQNQNIEKGIELLQTVLSISTNRRLQEDCNWYIGKAYLMRGEGPTAGEYFEKVQNSKGRKAQEAKEILLELKK